MQTSKYYPDTELYRVIKHFLTEMASLVWVWAVSCLSSTPGEKILRAWRGRQEEERRRRRRRREQHHLILPSPSQD